MSPAALETIVRAGGKSQVTYHGHPLYYFIGDASRGFTAGQGSSGFGAKCRAVTSAGTPIKAAPKPVKITTTAVAFGNYWWVVSPGGTPFTG